MEFYHRSVLLSECLDALHIKPDGDCMGSCMGLYNYILKKYPDTYTDDNALTDLLYDAISLAIRQHSRHCPSSC